MTPSPWRILLGTTGLGAGLAYLTWATRQRPARFGAPPRIEADKHGRWVMVMDDGTRIKVNAPDLAPSVRKPSKVIQGPYRRSVKWARAEAKRGGLAAIGRGEVVFEAATRGGKYRLVVYQEGDRYTMRSYTGGSEAGAAVGYTRDQMAKRLHDTLYSARWYDNIDYRIVRAFRPNEAKSGGLATTQDEVIAAVRRDAAGQTAASRRVRQESEAEIRGATCPYCGARSGRPCKTASGAPLERAHRKREAHWFKLDQELRRRGLRGPRTEGLDGVNMRGRIEVTFSNDRFGNCTGRVNNEKWHRCFARVARDNGAGSDIRRGFYFNRSCQEVLDGFKRFGHKQRRDLEGGWNETTVLMDPWEAGHLYGYDAHHCAEGRR